MMKTPIKFAVFLYSILYCFILSAQGSDCSNYDGVSATILDSEVCSSFEVNFEFQFTPPDPNPDGAFYFFEIYGSDGSIGFGDGDGFFGFGSASPEPIDQCEPLSVDYFADVFCEGTGEVVESGISLGTVLVYPNLNVEVELPGCGEGETGSATLVTDFGTVCDGPVFGTPGVSGDCETQVSATLDYVFDPFSGTFCEITYEDNISVSCSTETLGCTDATACNFNPEATCDDGSCDFIEPCCPIPVFDEIVPATCGSIEGDSESNLCISFESDVTGIFEGTAFIEGENGEMGFEVSSDPISNEVCFEVFAFNEECAPIDSEFFIFYECLNGNSYNASLGTISVYPDFALFAPFVEPSGECGGTPFIFSGICGEVILGEETPPNNDCDMLTPGSIEWTVDPFFDIADAPACFVLPSGTIPIAPCSEGCSCDGTLCEGTCFDLVVETGDVPPSACAFDGTLVGFSITGEGADFGSYSVIILSGNTFVGSIFHNPGDPTDFEIITFLDNPTCLPVDYNLTYIISCIDGSDIVTGTIGTTTVYPDWSFFYPEEGFIEPCTTPLLIPAPCGTVITDIDPIPAPECGQDGQDQFISWTVDTGFDLTDAPPCFDLDILEGELFIPVCPLEEGEPCELSCLGEGTIENCLCVVADAPTFELVGDLPAGVCEGEPISIDVNGIGTLSSDPIEVIIRDLNFNIYTSVFVDENTQFPVTLDIFTFSNGPCTSTSYELVLEARCSFDFSFIYGPELLGTFTVYPSPFNFAPIEIPGQVCGELPVVTPNDFCGGEITTDVVLPVDDCDAPVAGSIDWILTPPFDITDAPACFTDGLTGSTAIAPCLEDCPCDGIQCGGVCLDLTVEVGPIPPAACAFDETLIGVTVTGIGADFGNYVIEVYAGNVFIGSFFHNSGDPTDFEVSGFLENATCLPIDVELTYQVFCGFDGQVLDAGTIGTTTVYPNIFQFFPEEVAVEPCTAPQFIPAPCGTIIIDVDPIPDPECGPDGEDQFIPWTVDAGFDISDAPPCFDVNILQGELFIPACPLEEGEPCEDACLGEGTIENCLCVVPDAPTLELVGALPSVCQDEFFTIEVNVLGTLPAEPIEVILYDSNFNINVSFSVDQNSPLPLTFDLVPFFFDIDCNPVDYDLFVEARCSFDFSLIYGPESIGTLTIYPSPSNFTPIEIPGQVCGELPEVTPNDFCGGELTTDVVLPVDDCDAPVAGSLDWVITPPFDITDAPACFTDGLSGSIGIAPCLEDCGCDGVQCEGSCLDLTVEVGGLPAEVCTNESVSVTVDVLGSGADFGEYFIEMEINGNLNGFIPHSAGDPTSYVIDLSPFSNSCEPETQEVTYSLTCSDGTVIGTGILGSFLVYPSIFNFIPEINPSIACVQELEIIQPLCGTLILDPITIPQPGCGEEDEVVNWSVDFGFEFPADCNLESLSGTETVFACVGTEGDPCDDGNSCTINDVLDADCNCVGEAPTISTTDVFPTSTCSGEEYSITATVTGDNTDGLIVVINDQFGNSIFFGFLTTENTIQIEGTFATFNCEVNTYDFTLELLCPATFSSFGEPFPLGSTTVYPSVEQFLPFIEPAGLCGEEPSIVAAACGDLITDVTPADAVACPVGNDGFVDWTVDTGLDLTDAPACFDVSMLSGQEPIIACSNCCAELVQAVVSEPGVYCSGDMTLVCADFAEPFTSDGEVSINGVDAIAGDTQICFDLSLENNTCSFADIAIPFEVLCADGSVTTAFTEPITITPDPNNWQFEVISGSCGIPPVINSTNSPCVINSSQTVITIPPVDGCPPEAGEVEITLFYLDDNFNTIDVNQIPCSGFPSTITAVQPGCSECPCPAEPTITSIDTDVCEGNMVQVCFAFAPGDEANAVGTQILVSGSSGTTFYVENLTGDGTALDYCIEFPMNSLEIECDPETEEYFINIICSNSEPIAEGLGPFPITIYPELDKFAYEIIPAEVNCPDAATLPEVVSVGECDLDIQSAVTIAPVDGCPETAGEFTYSINYLSPGDFANAPADCAFTSLVDATEPIPACTTCEPSCEGSISGVVTIDDDCDGNGGEAPSQPITLELYDEGGMLVATTTTDAAGFYLFDSLPCGNYEVVVDGTNLPCPQAAPTNPFVNVTVSEGDDAGNIDFSFDPNTDCITPVYAGCICLVRACESNSIYVAEVGADCSVGYPTPLSPGANWTFEWYLDGNLVETNTGHPYFSPSSTGNYTVIITDFGTCQYWDTAAPCTGIVVDEIIDCSDCGGE